jgi:hypothetical protein
VAGRRRSGALPVPSTVSGRNSRARTGDTDGIACDPPPQPHEPPPPCGEIDLAQLPLGDARADRAAASSRCGGLISAGRAQVQRGCRTCDTGYAAQVRRPTPNSESHWRWWWPTGEEGKVSAPVHDQGILRRLASSSVPCAGRASPLGATVAPARSPLRPLVHPGSPASIDRQVGREATEPTRRRPQRPPAGRADDATIDGHAVRDTAAGRRPCSADHTRDAHRRPPARQRHHVRDRSPEPPSPCHRKSRFRPHVPGRSPSPTG